MARAAKSRPTTILFVRHGRTATTGKVLPGRAKGLHLSAEGETQAGTVAKRIASSFDVAAIYTSPLERARETADPIAHETGITAKVAKGLLECDFGDWTGGELKKLNKMPEWKSVMQSPSRFRFPNGESFLEMHARVAGAIESMIDAHPGVTVVAVSHADPIKMALVTALNSSIEIMHNIDITPCSVTAIRYQPHSAMVLTVNATEDFRVTP